MKCKLFVLSALLVVAAACGAETPEQFPDESGFPEYARGVELLEAQGIFVPPFSVKFVDAPINLPRVGLVAGYVQNFASGAVIVVAQPCIGHTALLHELTHLSLFAEGGIRDGEHKLVPYWNAVRAANAIWRAEVCGE